MDLDRAALTASVATAALWAAKAVAIGLAGGLGRSPAEGPLFLLGFVCSLAAAVLVGAAWWPRRRVVGGVLGLVAFGVFGTLEAAAIAALTPARPGWAWSEVNLWVLALALLVAALVVRREREPLAVG